MKPQKKLESERIYDECGLNHRQRVFCEYYVSSGYAREKSAVQAGYSPRSSASIASELLKKPKVKEFIETKMKEAMEKCGASIEWRAEMLKKTAEACLEGKADKDGCVDAKGIIGSIGELNKMDGSYAPVHNKVDLKTSNIEDVIETVEKCEREINSF